MKSAVPLDIREYKEPNDAVSDFIIRKCKPKITALAVIVCLFTLILIFSVFILAITRSKIMSMLGVLYLVLLYGWCYGSNHCYRRIKILKKYNSLVAQNQYKYCFLKESKKLVVLFKKESLVIDFYKKKYMTTWDKFNQDILYSKKYAVSEYLVINKVDTIDHIPTGMSIRTRFNWDILINRIHAVAVVILTVSLCISALSCYFGFINYDFFVSILALPIGMLINFLVIFALLIIVRNSHDRYIFCLFAVFTTAELLFGAMYTLAAGSIAYKILLSAVMLPLIGFVLWYINKDIMTIKVALRNEQFRCCQATIIKEIEPSNIEKIFPVAFGYHSFVVEDQRGNDFTVKIRSKLHLYYSDCKGVKGTLITLDEDDNKKLFIL